MEQRASHTALLRRFQDVFSHDGKLVTWKQGRFHVSRCKTQGWGGRAPYRLVKSLVSPRMVCLEYFLALSLPQFPYLISEEIIGGSWGKDWDIEVVIRENKIGCGREWTDDAARWNCSLHGRSWEQLLLSLKVTAHVPIGMGWWWHMENLLSLSRVGPTLF